MIDEETVPFLDREETEDTSQFETTKLTTITVSNYGSQRSMVIPQDEMITYSWSELNVFCEDPTKRKSSCSLRNSCCQRDESQRKHILKNAFGVAYPGELLAILGSSGAGKTTLLNALTFRSSRNVIVSGLRCCNGVAVTSTSLTNKSAYVQQDELFIGTLTVKEHLIFQSLVRMDRKLTYKQRMTRIEEVISELGLTKCQHTRIGIPGRLRGISGGERKRLYFASEVLTNPSLMFCDEPTSGLDSFMAFSVVQVLKGLARTGKTVVCTIHQPSSEIFAMFDKLLLMAEGRVAFLGTPQEAESFFSNLGAPCPKNYNPADYFIQLLAVVPGKEESCKQAVSLICDKFERSEIGVRAAVEAASKKHADNNYYDLELNEGRRPYKVSWCMQFRALLWRSWIGVIKEPILIRVRIFQTVVISLVLGAIYFGQKLTEEGVMNINGALFIVLTNMTFQNLFAVINVFCSELPVFLREHRNGMYRTDVYFLSKTLAELPLFMFIPVLYVSIIYYMIGLNPDFERFLMTNVVAILVTNVATSFGYLISAASSSVSMALSIGPPIAIPALLFGGFFLNVKSIPSYLQWLSNFSWFKYGNEALMINQWDDVQRINCSISANSTCPRSGEVVLQVYNFHQENFWYDIIGLILLTCGFRFLAFLALLIKSFRAN